MGAATSKVQSTLKKHSLKQVSLRQQQQCPASGPLSATQYTSRLTFLSNLSEPSTGEVEDEEAGLTVRYAALSFRGYYPTMQGKTNQDACCAHSGFGGEPSQVFLGVFDGHGEWGTGCAQYALKHVPENLSDSSHFRASPEKAFDEAMVLTNEQLHYSNVNATLSGTTAVCALVRGHSLYIANVGDSRAVLGRREGDKIVAHDLTKDQTPYRQDECSRVREAGAVVLAQSQLEGIKDASVDVWTNEMDDAPNDHPYIWFATGGSAFTRSLGDLDAEQVGVIPNPEVTTVELTGDDVLLVLASDGVWEFLSSQEVVDICHKIEDPQAACREVVATAYRLWWVAERRTDDITLIVAKLSGLSRKPPCESSELADKAKGLSLKPKVHFGVDSQEQIGPKSEESDMNGHMSLFKAMKKSSSKPRLEDLAELEGKSLSKDRSHHKARSHLNLEMDLVDRAPSNSDESLFAASTVPKTPEQAEFIQQSLRRLPSFTKLPDTLLSKIVDAMEHRFVNEGEAITHQGDIGDTFFVVEDGTFAVMVIEDSDYEVDDAPEPRQVRQFRAGDCIAETALRVASTSGSTVIAEVDSAVWQLQRSLYKHIVKAHMRASNIKSVS